MPLEIEIKLKVESHVPIRAALRRLRARQLDPVLETNLFFDFPNRALRKKNSGLRIRTAVPLASHGKTTSTALLTFKGPPQRTGLRARNAYDLTLTPGVQTVPLLLALGFEQTLSYEKRRESWLCRYCRVELDELPHLGLFLEIEGPSERRVRSLQTALGLRDLPAVRSSYIHLVDSYLRAHRPKVHTLKFPHTR